MAIKVAGGEINRPPATNLYFSRSAEESPTPRQGKGCLKGKRENERAPFVLLVRWRLAGGGCGQDSCKKTGPRGYNGPLQNRGREKILRGTRRGNE